MSIGMLRYLPRSEWGRTSLGNVLRRNTPDAYSDELVEDALQRMTENSVTAAPVVDRETGIFLGSIASHEILELIVSAAKGHEV